MLRKWSHTVSHRVSPQEGLIVALVSEAQKLTMDIFCTNAKSSCSWPVIIIGNVSGTRCVKYVRFVVINYQIKSVKIGFLKNYFKFNKNTKQKRIKNIRINFGLHWPDNIDTSNSEFRDGRKNLKLVWSLLTIIIWRPWFQIARTKTKALVNLMQNSKQSIFIVCFIAYTSVQLFVIFSDIYKRLRKYIRL